LDADSTPASLMVLVSTTGGSKGMIMDTAARSPEAVWPARRGILMSEALAEQDGGRQVDLDGGQRLQVLDILITSIGGAYAHLPAKRAVYASTPRSVGRRRRRQHLFLR
jgi:hypothetical protein